MKVKLLFSICILYSNFLYSQNVTDYERTHFRVFLYGKALAGPTSTENKYGKSFTAGAGFYFFKYHSLSTDYVYFNNNYEHESLSTNGFYENNGTYDVSYRRYLIFSYRYEFLKNTYMFHPYLSAFMKLGKEDRLFDNGIDPRETTPLNYSADINEYGLVIGTKFDFGENNRMGLDFSFGFVNAYHFIHYGYTYSTTYTGTFVTNYLDSFWKPNIRLNLYVNLFKLHEK